MSDYYDEDDEGDKEEKEEEAYDKGFVDKIILLIDARESMFETTKNGDIKMKNCLRVATEIMKSKIVAGDNSTVGVTFFGTREKDKDCVYDGIFTKYYPTIPSARRIRDLQRMTEDLGLFDIEIGSQQSNHFSNLCPLKHAIWHCLKLFSSDTKFSAKDFKRIWIFTDDDSPNSHSIEEQSKTLKIAKDAADNGIEISLFHFNSDKRGVFDINKFYLPLVKLGLTRDTRVQNGADVDIVKPPPSREEEEEYLRNCISGAGDETFDSIAYLVLKKVDHKRRAGKVSLTLAGQKIALDVYKLFNCAKKPSHQTYLYKNSEKFEPVKTITKYIDGDTGAVLSEDLIETTMEIFGLKFVISADQVNSIKRENDSFATAAANEEDDPSSITIMCFVPPSAIRNELNVKTSYYLYPNESTIKGSKSLYASLTATMKEKDMVALARFTLNPRSVPRMAAIIPYLAGENGAGPSQEGLYVVLLPYEEEVRYNPDPVPDNLLQNSITAATVAAARNIINALRADPTDEPYWRKYETPSLQNFYGVINALALGEGDSGFVDRMHVDQNLAEKAVDAAGVFQDECYLGENPVMLLVDTKKRPAPSEALGVAKKSAAAVTVAEINGFKKLASENKLGKLTVEELKDVCRRLGVAVSGVKTAIVARIEEALAKIS